MPVWLPRRCARLLAEIALLEGTCRGHAPRHVGDHRSAHGVGDASGVLATALRCAPPCGWRSLRLDLISGASHFGPGAPFAVQVNRSWVRSRAVPPRLTTTPRLTGRINCYTLTFGLGKGPAKAVYRNQQAVDLTDEQWAIVKRLFSRESRNTGRPPTDSREVLTGVFWVMRTGSPWSSLPAQYPSREVCRRRYLKWKRSGKLREALALLYEDLCYRYNVSSCAEIDRPRARDRASWWWQTALLLRSPDAAMILGADLSQAIVTGSGAP